MVAYSFKSQFAPLIATGAKRHTLRNERKRHARAGETLQLYTGMRTKHCRLIGTATCLGVLPIRIDFDLRRVEYGSGHAITTPDDTEAFAQHDGFAGWKAMEAFWAKEHPHARQWSGVQIVWGGTFKATS